MMARPTATTPGWTTNAPLLFVVVVVAGEEVVEPLPVVVVPAGLVVAGLVVAGLTLVLTVLPVIDIVDIVLPVLAAPVVDPPLGHSV